MSGEHQQPEWTSSIASYGAGVLVGIAAFVTIVVLKATCPVVFVGAWTDPPSAPEYCSWAFIRTPDLGNALVLGGAITVVVGVVGNILSWLAWKVGQASSEGS